MAAFKLALLLALLACVSADDFHGRMMGKKREVERPKFAVPIQRKVEVLRPREFEVPRFAVPKFVTPVRKEVVVPRPVVKVVKPVELPVKVVKPVVIPVKKEVVVKRPVVKEVPVVVQKPVVKVVKPVVPKVVTPVVVKAVEIPVCTNEAVIKVCCKGGDYGYSGDYGASDGKVCKFIITSPAKYVWPWDHDWYSYSHARKVEQCKCPVVKKVVTVPVVTKPPTTAVSGATSSATSAATSTGYMTP